MDNKISKSKDRISQRWKSVTHFPCSRFQSFDLGLKSANSEKGRVEFALIREHSNCLDTELLG